ncbi:DsrE family protein [Marinicella sp. W31]|uniref:DsrE family protein n=1 Tax=Marinicella sp. W31 TaxID=3023713 RepID=UPI003757CC4B
MKLAIMINAQDDWQQTNAHAMALLDAFVQNNHEIVGVFFYGRSVNMVTQQDTSRQWLNWIDQNHTSVVVCSTMLTQEQLTTDAENLGFPVAGMAAWVNWCQQADRIMELT